MSKNSLRLETHLLYKLPYSHYEENTQITNLF